MTSATTAARIADDDQATIGQPLQGDVLAGTARDIRAHPNFSAAAIHYLENILRWRAGPRLLNKVVGSYVRSQIIGYLLYLHFIADPADPDSGPTFPALMDMCDERKQCSSRVLKTVLALTWMAGFVSIHRGQNDRRQKIYRPTAKLLDHVREWYTHTYGCFDILVEGSGYAAQMATDPACLAHLIVSISVPFHEHGIEIGEHYPSIHELLTQDCGFPVIGTLVAADLSHNPLPSVTMISQRFGSSASQVRNVIRMATASGLITVSEQKKIIDLQNLSSLYQDFIARELALYAKYALGLDDVLAGIAIESESSPMIRNEATSS